MTDNTRVLSDVCATPAILAECELPIGQMRVNGVLRDVFVVVFDPVSKQPLKNYELDPENIERAKIAFGSVITWAQSKAVARVDTATEIGVSGQGSANYDEGGKEQWDHFKEALFGMRKVQVLSTPESGAVRRDDPLSLPPKLKIERNTFSCIPRKIRRDVALPLAYSQKPKEDDPISDEEPIPLPPNPRLIDDST